MVKCKSKRVLGMEDKDWLLLQTLYEQQNITKTAEILFISQPAITYRIQQLEKEFGIIIIHRGRRGVEFTPQGESLVKYAKDMILQLHKTKEYLLSIDNKVAGTLKVGSTNSLATYKLPHILKKFSTLFPDVEFKVLTKMSSELVNLVFKQDVHVGFIRHELGWPDEKQLLMVENICIVSKSEVHINELPSLSRIVYKTDSSLENTIDNWWKATFSKPPTITMEVDKMETCKEMVINGLGYAIMPDLLLHDIPEIFKYQLKTKYGEPILRKSWMIYRKESMQMALIKAFVDFVKDISLV